ncbi:hypothetical protein PF005_g19134 [Phytophthora fragariae]|uniref:Ferric reductase NAD binding domain-containing protein n=1 Tax=Phytophthora fragariae TaxID=53985 RepID=A0A6A3SNW3_9STRA|nr:hypothetical protein PF003_g3135 [Phytophthora fragariae]KAE8929809.1 hypothetical protein PF009_g20082 [Phytophthora fragariae]KAE8991351.1 hypothetical protein PF011_g17976 [Phytophthora fragariae]KAE9090491.1 hypothetical protein PF010_g18561 [Phytophthora fragariae]KAE9090501.1 hypothetical protein PF007_g19213 [Phytophthora fragariae]
MRSIVNWLHHEVNTEGRSGVERVQFVWSVRDRDTIEAMIGDKELKPGLDSYFPHDLMAAQVNQGGVFSSEIYLTRGERDLEGLGEQAKQSGKHRVAVLVCGPSPMVRQVLAVNMALGKDMKVQFDVHSELFEF